MRIGVMLAAVVAAVGCAQSSSEPPGPDAAASVDAAREEDSSNVDGLSLLDVGPDEAAALLRCGSDVAILPDLEDPTLAVTDWSQVQDYNCARGDGGQIIACSRDEQCPTDRVCDNSAGCGCCVPPPPLVDSSRPLRRALFTQCTSGRCSPPSYCSAAADLRTCAMTFPGTIAVWAMRYQAPANVCPLDDFRRQLCIKVEAWQSCLWLLDLPGGSYSADAPFPTDYTDVYECGGRTCNGAETFRVRPRAGTTFTATLVVDNCSP